MNTFQEIPRRFMDRSMNRPIICINLKNAVKILVSGFIKEVISLKINFQTNSFVPFTTLGREF